MFKFLSNLFNFTKLLNEWELIYLKTKKLEQILSNNMPDDTLEHVTALEQAVKVKTYLDTLPGKFASLKQQLADALANSDTGLSDEQKAEYQAVIDRLVAEGDELEAALGVVSTAVDTAEAAESGEVVEPAPVEPEQPVE